MGKFGPFTNTQIVFISPLGELVILSYFGRAFSYVLTAESDAHFSLCSYTSLLLLGYEELGDL